jgi:hypothetical protein
LVTIGAELVMVTAGSELTVTVTAVLVADAQPVVVFLLCA